MANTIWSYLFNKKQLSKWVFIPLTMIVIAIIFTFASYYNTIQALDEKQSGAAAEVINQYKRRADLITNLVNTVKAYTEHEQSVFADIAASRAALSQLNITPESFQNEVTLQNFEKMQSALKTELSRLLVIVESYPELQANELYKNLMVQLEGTENRITVARNRYIEAVREYNTTLRKVPYVFLANVFDYRTLPQFSIEDSNIEQPPVVTF
mgnify:FL=1